MAKAGGAKLKGYMDETAAEIKRLGGQVPHLETK
jgi:hypothetical protein